MKYEKFYPILDNSDLLKIAVSSGVKFAQLRLKNISEEKIEKEILFSREFCFHNNAQLVVNDYWEQALNANCNFVHLGQEDMLDADINFLKKKNVKIGVSTHDEEELDNALSISPDYVALGPIWETKLKKMKWAPQGLLRIKLWRKKIGNIPLVAIGGLNIERAKLALKAGADIVSVVSDITLSKNPKKTIIRWIKEIR